MRMTQFASAVLTACVAVGAVTLAREDTSNKDLVVAVFGDSPYGDTNTDTLQTDATNAFIDTMNNANADLVLMVGDIHSGKQFCTEAYDRTIFDKWSRFTAPLIYTPGDNEWTDCHKTGEGGGAYNSADGTIHYVANGSFAQGDPIANLELVRSIFFATPGLSLGHPAKPVLSQAFNVDPMHPSDANYIENVMFEHKGVLFVTINLPGGSNNDADNWYGVPTRTDAQSNEISERTGADLRWLDAAFARAISDGVRAVVIQLQADMWDRDTKAVSHIANYTAFIDKIARHTSAFARPVLLLNGDSHSYRSDNPLKAKQACLFESGAATVACDSLPDPGDGSYTRDAWDNHPGYEVSNFHRLIPHGSTHTATDGSRPPMEWIKLTITPGANTPTGANSFGPFTWERVITTVGAVVNP